VSGKCFSDCLWAPLIDEINIMMNEGKVKYSEKGLKRMCYDLREVFQNNLVILGCVDDIEKWMINSI